MAKANKMVNLGSMPVNGKKSPVYLNTGDYTLQRTTRGRRVPVSDFYGELTKGEARRIRKALRDMGYSALAALPRT